VAYLFSATDAKIFRRNDNPHNCKGEWIFSFSQMNGDVGEKAERELNLFIKREESKFCIDLN
jgi:hypothetical protein